MRFRFCGDLDSPDWLLAEINTLSQLSSVRLKVLSSQVINSCLNGDLNFDRLLKLAGDSPTGTSDLKGAMAAVHFIITSATKYDVDEIALVAEIQQLGLPKENAEVLGRQLRDHKDALRSRLDESSLRTSRLLSADWRVDQVFAHSSSTGNEAVILKAPEKRVQLNLRVDSCPTTSSGLLVEGSEIAAKKGGQLETLAMELTVSELDVLVAELQSVRELMAQFEC